MKRTKTLLVLPGYYSQYPPLGLLKISALKKMAGNKVFLCYLPSKHNKMKKRTPKWEGVCDNLHDVPFYPDEILITSLFTFAWKEVHEAIFFAKNKFPKAPITVGGIYASLMPDRLRKLKVKVLTGLIPEAEEMIPDYSLFPKWDYSIVFSARGCIRKCEFCAVKIVEPVFKIRDSIKYQVIDKHKKIVIWDNNFLGSKDYKSIIDQLVDIGKPVDFNQGLDVRLMTKEKINQLKRIKIDGYLRIAYDDMKYQKEFNENIALMKKMELVTHDNQILSYVLYNFNDRPDNFVLRIKECLSLGIRVFPMRFEPLDSLKRRAHVGKWWNVKQLKAVQQFISCVGKGGGLTGSSKELLSFFQKRKTFDICFFDKTPIYQSKYKNKYEEKGFFKNL